MSLDKRSTFILNKLIHSEEYVYAGYLMKKLNVSRRTIYYDLDKINSWLEDHQLACVERSYAKGFYLPKMTRQKAEGYIKVINENQYFYTRDERISLLGIYLVLGKGAIHLRDLMAMTDVSRVTTFQDLRELKKIFADFGLTIIYNRIDGYCVTGNETYKRKVLVHYLTRLHTQQGWDRFSGQILSIINPRIPRFRDVRSKEKSLQTKGIPDYAMFMTRSEKSMAIELTDEMLRDLALHLFVICNRIEQGMSVVIDSHEKSALHSTPEYTEAQQLARQLGKWCGVSFSKDEVCYLTTHLLGAKVNTLPPGYKQNQEMKELQQAMKRMIFDFQKYACVFFQDQDELENLMFVHLKPAYYRLKYNVFSENPLTDEIKMQYQDVFQITKKVVYHFGDLLGKTVDEQETAYIAMYFGGWMRRQNASPVKRRKALIVCENGLGTSNLLRIQLESLISSVEIADTISLREYQQNQYEADLFFSTIELPLPEKEKPVIVVNPILTDEDKRSLLSQLNVVDGRDPMLASLLDIIQQYAEITDEQKLIQNLKSFLQPNREILKETFKPMLHELLTKEMIQLKPSVDSWEDAIRVAADPLLKNDYITDDYVDAMIENVKQLGPYIVIVPNIAIPHARPEHGVNHLGMSLLRLEKPVEFSSEGEHPAQLIIILAAVDNDAHLKALAQLTTLLSDEEKVEKIISASSSQEITSLLEDLPANNQ